MAERKFYPYDEEKAEIILTHLMDGETLTSICRTIDIRPSTIYRWTQANEEFRQRFARAREFGDSVLEDQAIDHSDERNTDDERVEYENDKACGTSRKVFDNVARSRLMAETRLKVVARRKGAKITNTIKLLKKTEAEEAEGLSNEELLEIARMTVDDGENA